MRGKNFLGNLHTLVALAAMASLLTGCLEDEKAKQNNSGPPPTTGNSAPTISGSPPTAVMIGQTYAFMPTASDADEDPLNFSIANLPRWLSFDSTNGELRGQATLGDSGVYRDVQISVTDGKDSASLPTFSISVDQNGTVSTTLTWTAPVENEDGSTLTDLAGYRIYWGTTPGVYPNSVTVSNAGVTSYVVDNLTPGTYQFVATSFNAAGTESAYSNPATKVLN